MWFGATRGFVTGEKKKKKKKKKKKGIQGSLSSDGIEEGGIEMFSRDL